jgi:hypothetical protein
MQEGRKRNTLDYGKPDAPISASRVFAGVFSIPAAYIGLAAISYVIGELLMGLGNNTNRATFVRESVVITLIGLASLYLACRLIRYAYRGSHRPS